MLEEIFRKKFQTLADRPNRRISIHLYHPFAMADPAANASALLAALPELEKTLEALQSRPWAETADALAPLERAKMDILLSYAVNDLIWGLSSFAPV